ncbi:hypothetical protein [Paraglaciecola chathamensis]|uniref:hypothetical protein n=1 Tax=Paraglaciecola chathamensis TaxID=368405 RepID=UPI00058721E4|nr:hypothetical protein [Paraglaciecola chathamensis]
MCAFRQRRAISQQEPSVNKSRQPKSTTSQQEPSVNKSLQPESAVSPKEPSAQKCRQRITASLAISNTRRSRLGGDALSPPIATE